MDRRPDRARVGVAARVGDCADRGRAVVPPHDDDVEVAGDLRGSERDTHRGLRRLRRGIIALHVADGGARTKVWSRWLRWSNGLRFPAASVARTR